MQNKTREEILTFRTRLSGFDGASVNFKSKPKMEVWVNCSIDESSLGSETCFYVKIPS